MAKRFFFEPNAGANKYCFDWQQANFIRNADGSRGALAYLSIIPFYAPSQPPCGLICINTSAYEKAPNDVSLIMRWNSGGCSCVVGSYNAYDGIGCAATGDEGIPAETDEQPQDQNICLGLWGS